MAILALQNGAIQAVFKLGPSILGLNGSEFDCPHIHWSEISCKIKGKKTAAENVAMEWKVGFMKQKCFYCRFRNSGRNRNFFTCKRKRIRRPTHSLKQRSRCVGQGRPWEQKKSHFSKVILEQNFLTDLTLILKNISGLLLHPGDLRRFLFNKSRSEKCCFFSAFRFRAAFWPGRKRFSPLGLEGL